MADVIDYDVESVDEVRSIAELGARAAAPHQVGFDEAYLVPDGEGSVVVLETPELPLHPVRATNKRVVTDENAFIDYVKRHGDEQTEVWAHLSGNQVVGIIDGHASNMHVDERFGWNEHRVTLALEHTPSWKEWVVGQNLRGQVELAEFLEEHAPDIVHPSAGELLEIAQTLHGTNKVEFTSGTRLSTGETRFAYVEDTQGKAGKSGDLVIPDEFKIALQPYVGGERYQVTAKLRWRLNGGNMQIFYKLLNLDRVLEVAFEEIVGKIREGIEYPVFNGRP